jgi:hypothetical protein
LKNKVKNKVKMAKYETIYGTVKLFSDYIGFKSIPFYLNGDCQHGWIYPERNIHPEFVIGTDGLSQTRKNHRYYVAREDQVIFLKSNGYKNVYAIGFPFIYLNHKKININRRAGHLLVMPPHSLPESQEDWNEGDYVDYIESIKHKFKSVDVCISHHCWEKGNWIKSFREKGFTVIRGLSPTEPNYFQKLAELFGQYEYLSSNELGSQVVLASFLGVRCSICGPRLKWKKKDFENIAFYKNCPEILDIYEQWDNKSFIKSCYPQLHVDPWRATINKEWADFQLGLVHKKNPLELKALLEWGGSSLFTSVIRYYFRRASRRVKKLIKIIFP